MFPPVSEPLEVSTSAEAQTEPPTFHGYGIYSIKLVAKDTSKIVSVSVYSGRAEITRIFKFNVKTGQNQVTITGLPNLLDHESLRVEGRGSATIHDVTVSNVEPTITPPVPTTSPTLTTLLSREEKAGRALERCKKSLGALETYLSSMDVRTIDVTQIGAAVKEYDFVAEGLDDRVLELGKELRDLDEQIKEERTKLRVAARPSGDETSTPTKKAVIGIFADGEGEVEIVLIYAVNGASWTAGYDIRVDTSNTEKPVTLIYKAAIKQYTNEDWTDVPLTLETATPTYGLAVPKLNPWTLSVYRPAPPPPAAPVMIMQQPAIVMPEAAAPPPPPPPPFSRTRSAMASAPKRMSHQTSDVVTKGGSDAGVNATFQVPGLITIPSDGEAHNVTIAKLELGAEMSWVGVPKKDVRMRLNAKIQNASQYTLLRGSSSVYVNGSFIAKSDIPGVSPGESFDCPLGLDPSLRTTYHLLQKKLFSSSTGVFSKTTTASYNYTQLITIQNTKSSIISNVRVFEQVPISEDAQITVKLLSPSLASGPSPTDADALKNFQTEKIKAVTVSKGITAFWEGADELSGKELQHLGLEVGKDGKFVWVCSIPPQAKINLVLQYEIAVPLGTNVVGLPQMPGGK